MIRYVDYYEDSDYEGRLVIKAEDQSWNKRTLKQLREEHDIIFKSAKDAVTPVKVLRAGNGRYGIALGSEDDGTIQFEQYGGEESRSYKHEFSDYWIDALISDLQAAKKYIAELKAKDETEKERKGK